VFFTAATKRDASRAQETKYLACGGNGSQPSPISPTVSTLPPVKTPGTPNQTCNNHYERNQTMSDYRVQAGDIHEDQVTSLMESYSAKLPSSFFLGASFASIIGSLILKAQGKDENALFVGQWAAPFLLLGIYNKMVKQHGSDADTRD
jgi:hypothetical protein